MAKLTKVSDDKFNGKHPNKIYKGYVKEGHVHSEVKVGVCFAIGTLITSRVTEVIESAPGSIKFKTRNSTYLLEYGKKELTAKHERILVLPQEFRCDYLGINQRSALSAEGVLFQIGDKVKHDGDDDDKIGTIEEFMLDTATMDVKAKTEHGIGRICFLYH